VRQLPKNCMLNSQEKPALNDPSWTPTGSSGLSMANTEWRDDPDEIELAMDRKNLRSDVLVPSGGYRHAARVLSR